MSVTFSDLMTFPFRPRNRSSTSQWGSGLAVAVVLHLAALAALLRYPPSQVQQPSGPVIAVDVVTPPAPQKQLTPQHQNRALSQQPHTVAALATPSATLPATAAAMVPTATHAADAPSVHNVADAGAMRASWAADVLHRLEQFKRYPPEAAEARQQGIVQLHFQISRGGDVLSVRIARGSGYDLLDAEAMALVRRARPLPKPPEQFPGDVFDLTVPVRFSLGH